MKSFPKDFFLLTAPSFALDFDEYIEFPMQFIARLRRLRIAEYSPMWIAIESNKGHEADGLTTAILKKTAHIGNVWGLSDKLRREPNAPDKYGVWTGRNRTLYFRSLTALVTAGKFNYYDDMFGAERMQELVHCGSQGGAAMREKFQQQLSRVRLEPLPESEKPTRLDTTGPRDSHGKRVRSMRDDLAVVTGMTAYTWLRMQAGRIDAKKFPGSIEGLPQILMS